MKSSPIEVANFSDSTQISELASAVWSNHEPGFQIDGVSSVDELYEVFDIVRAAAPYKYARDIKFAGVYPDNPYAFDSRMGSNGVHLDGPSFGLAVHQNLSQPIVVELAHPKVRFSTEPAMRKRSVSNLRIGETIPGRLTVFSEGGYDWLKPTAHHFVRNNLKNEWVRYTQDSRGSSYYYGEDTVKLIAQAAFTRLDKLATVASEA